MKVILLKSVPKLGKVDDIVEVPDGYAANALFPKRLATPATPSTITARNRKLEGKVEQTKLQHELLDKAISTLDGKALVYTARANEQGSLFSKVTADDIAQVLLDQYRLSIDSKKLLLPEQGIKHVGLYTIGIVDGTYKATFQCTVGAAS